MKLVTYRTPHGPAEGLLEGDAVIPSAGGDALALSDIEPLAPVSNPGKIICVGLNYRDHAVESGMEIPKSPVLFTKFANTIAAPGEAIVLPPFSSEVDYEAELAVVIGTRAQRVSVDEARSHIAGFTCANDVSARDLQFADGQWFRGKGQDTFCPLGPWLVSPDEVPDPQNLGIRCYVNDVALQDSNTSEMIFSVDQIISFISQGITLEPGDVILTGTPVGVGFARKPPVFLKDGDVVRVEIDGLGSLENPVKARS